MVRNINPSYTNYMIAEYARASAEDAKAAIAAAKAAFPAWSRSGILERHAILRKTADEILARKDELGRLLSREEGKTLAEGIGETVRAGQIFDFFAGEALRLAGEVIPSVRPGIGVEITREPVGVVGIITPWNFPIAIPAWKIAPALCYGNTVVFKPADLVPGSAWALAEILSRSGLPAGVFALLTGTGNGIGQTLVAHPAIQAVGFTGSRSGGTALMAVAAARPQPIPVYAEMSSINPVYLLPLVELVGGSKTTPETIARAMTAVEQIGMKGVVIAKEIEAFVGDRLLEALWREALWLIQDDICDTETLDNVMRYSFGMRWAQMGLFETYRIAGGEAGMRHFLAQFGPCLKWPWTKFTDVVDLDDALVEKIGAQSDAQAAGRSIRELERIRDENLVGIMHALKSGNGGEGWGAGKLLADFEAKLWAN
eukprot:gene44335-54217_t